MIAGKESRHERTELVHHRAGVLYGVVDRGMPRSDSNAIS